jgi:hypothetical protein
MDKQIAAFEKCRETCGACKSECIENNECDLVTVCDLCMMACAMKIISMRRPSHCHKETCKKITALCKDLIKKCHDQCLQYGHAECVKACKSALIYC